MVAEVKPRSALDGPLIYFPVLFAIVLAMMPPTGLLSDNEENYFGLAARAVGAIAAMPESALFDAARHRFLNEFLLGHLIGGIGFEYAQIIARILAAAGYALALTLWCRGFALRLVDAVTVLLVFAALGQTLMGGEWLFGGYEGKVGAYVFAIFGLYAVVSRGQLGWAAAALVVATYFHFLVGGFWFAAALLYAVVAGESLRKIIGALIGYVAGVAPLLIVMAGDRLNDVAPSDYRGPTPDAIYSLIRSPHHVEPFLNWENFRDLWLPGLVLAALMLAAAIAIARRPREPRLRPLAIWLMILLAYLLLAAAVSLFDRDTGWLGKFYLFRPAALMLLLWLTLAAGWARDLPPRVRWPLRLIFLAATVPGFVMSVGRIPGGIAWFEKMEADQTALYAAIPRLTAPGDVVLIDPALEYAYYDFERSVSRATLVAWKFDNTDDRDIVEWYRRMQFRAALFDQGCGAARPWRVDFLLAAPNHAEAVSRSCGVIVYRDEHAALIQIR
jgi:hypothetical protein